ncbi:MAG: CHASE2 domain-containing protein, partial [Cyanobacteria bacterium P01_H01_bin.105]
PCAAWLPTIYQNPADSPPTWHTIIARSSAPTNIITPIPIDPVQSVDHRASRKSRFLKMFSHAVSIFVILGLRQLGLFQHLELKAFDQFMHLRAREAPDSRFLIVTVTDADIQAQPDKYRRGSLSDKALLALMKALETMEPRVIGLDIYRDFLVQPQYPELASMLATHDNFLAVCKSRDSVTGSAAIAPPPEVSDERVGFSDFLVDTDGGVRRQLLAMKPEPSSSCTTEYSFGALLALNYLAVEEVITKASPQGYLQINDLIFTPITDSQGSYQNVDSRGQQLLLNYRSLARPDQIADSVTLTEVLAGDVNPESVRDRIVLIGTTDISYGDLWLTPYSKSSRAEDQTSGVFMQAQMASHLISAVLDDRPLIKTWPDWGELVWLLLWGCIGSLLIAGWRKHQHYTLSRYILSLLATELSLFGTCWLLLSRYYYWVPWAPPTALLLIIFGILPIYEHLLLSPSKVNIKEAL